MPSPPIVHRAPERFAFRGHRQRKVITCSAVRDGAPILVVTHDHDGDWQFLCGGDEHDDDRVDPAVAGCLECVVAGDPSLNDVADLPLGALAERPDRESEWERGEPDDGDAADAEEKPDWTVMLVGNGPGDVGPAFAYTVGLHEPAGPPEVICVGLPWKVMHALLNACGTRLRAGTPLPVGTPFELVPGPKLLLRPVRDPKSYDEHVGECIVQHRGRDFPLLQLVWPDREGRFPGDPGAPAELFEAQPLLP